MIISANFIHEVRGEIQVVDAAAERAAQESLGPDATILGFKTANPRVSIVKGMKIVRMDLFDPAKKKKVGIALRIERKDRIDESIHIF